MRQVKGEEPSVPRERNIVILASIVALLLAGTALAEVRESGWYRELIGRTATALDTPELYEKNKETRGRGPTSSQARSPRTVPSS